MRRRLLHVLVVAAVLAVAAFGLARVAADDPPPTPEATITEVQRSLRCPTCQGLSVADSPSPIAKAMREEIRERVTSGQSPEEVRAHFVTRYGEWILLSPPRRGLNWLLWLLPGLVVVAGIVLATRQVRRRRQPPEVDASDLEHARAVHLAHTRGRYTPAASGRGERIEAALRLLDSIDEEEPTDASPPGPGGGPPAPRRGARGRGGRLRRAHIGRGGRP